MYEITGLCKRTLRFVQVAIATNRKERDMILEQEADNYYNLTFTRVRFAA